MRNVRNITIAVDPELFRQTRRLAVDYNTSVNGMVRHSLGVLFGALKAARVSGGHPQLGSASVRAQATCIGSEVPLAQQPTAPAAIVSQPAIDPISCGSINTVSTPNPFPVRQLHPPYNNPKPFFNSSCKTVKAPQPNHFQ